jgi:hypothetical protein
VLSTKKIFGVSLLLLLSGIAGPASAQTATDQPMTREVDGDGFDDWGLLGLLGLAGLLGRKGRGRDTMESRRVEVSRPAVFERLPAASLR